MSSIVAVNAVSMYGPRSPSQCEVLVHGYMGIRSHTAVFSAVDDGPSAGGAVCSSRRRMAGTCGGPKEHRKARCYPQSRSFHAAESRSALPFLFHDPNLLVAP